MVRISSCIEPSGKRPPLIPPRTAPKIAVSDKCREIILLKVVEGKKNKEIANQLGLAETTVKTQVQRAYRILREQLIPILLFISWLQNGG